MTARAVMMESMQRLQFNPKNDHHLKLINSVEKKVEGAKHAKETMQRKQAEEIIRKKGKINALKAELAKIAEEKDKKQQEIEKVETALSTEETYLTDVVKIIDEAQEINNEIQKIQTETDRFEATVADDLRALHQNRMKIDNLHICNIEYKEKIDDLKLKSRDSFHHSTLLDQHLEDVYNLMLMIQSPKVSLEDLEANEIFQREYNNNLLYITNKNNIEEKTKENNDINGDLERLDAKKLVQEQELKKFRESLVESEAKKLAALNELNNLKTKEIETQEKLNKKQETIRCADGELQLKIRDLKSAHVKEEEEIDELRSRNLTVIADLNMKLKLEEQKTAQAKEHKKTALKEEKDLSIVLKNAHVTSSTQPPVLKRQKIDEKSDASRISVTQRQPAFPASRRSIPTPPLSSSFDSLPGIPDTRKSAPASVPVKENVEPAIKTTQKPAQNIDVEAAFSDDEFSVIITKFT